MSYALELIEKGRRIDGRGFTEFRPILLQEGIIRNAEGSARVKFGETEVVAGVKLEIGKPFPDSPEEGVLIVNAEFTPLASPDFEPGPPGENAIELARIVDRGIRESKCLELNKLCIVPKEKVWCVFIDIYIINHQGNLLDASALASIAALRNSKIPKFEDDVVIRGEYDRELPVIFRPVSVSIIKVKRNFLIDPLLEEEDIAEVKLSIGIRDDDKICSIQKQGRGTFSFEEIEMALDLAIEKSKELRRLVS